MRGQPQQSSPSPSEVHFDNSNQRATFFTITAFVFVGASWLLAFLADISLFGLREWYLKMGIVVGMAAVPLWLARYYFTTIQREHGTKTATAAYVIISGVLAGLYFFLLSPLAGIMLYAILGALIGALGGFVIIAPLTRWLASVMQKYRVVAVIIAVPVPFLSAIILLKVAGDTTFSFFWANPVLGFIPAIVVGIVYVSAWCSLMSQGTTTSLSAKEKVAGALKGDSPLSSADDTSDRKSVKLYSTLKLNFTDSPAKANAPSQVASSSSAVTGEKVVIELSSKIDEFMREAAIRAVNINKLDLSAETPLRSSISMPRDTTAFPFSSIEEAGEQEECTAETESKTETNLNEKVPEGQRLLSHNRFIKLSNLSLSPLSILGSPLEEESEFTFEQNDITDLSPT